MILRSFIFILLITIGLDPLLSQVSSGGLPPSFSSHLKSAVQSEFISAPNMQQIDAEDAASNTSNKPYRIAKMIDTDFCIHSGTSDTLPSGEIIWRLNLYSPDALGLQLVYSNFYLPPGARLFIYSADKKFVIGAFTDLNNDPSGSFATEIVPGESCTVELVVSPFTVERPRFCISQVGYVYRGINFVLPGTSRLKSAGACQVNVNCSPEGDNWKDVKRSVARIYMSGYLCSGNLLNNTAQDYKRYFSTAYHCIEGIENSSSSWIFYFNYERSTCSNSSALTTARTTTGALIRAKTPINGGGDGALLELTGSVPPSYQVYYAGWDRADSAISGGVCIHHPDGDSKKISTIRDRWYATTWYGSDDDIGAKNAHWYTVFSETANGHGTTEGGSSGSGVFGPDELFRGSLSGGISSCDIPSGGNLFGKLAYNWDQFGSTSDLQYKPWLDPLNTGAKKVRGADPNNTTAFQIYWTSSFPNIEIDSVVKFTDETAGSPLTRNWSFPGGTPATSTEINPVVKYTEPGLYDVTLTVTTGGNTYTKKRTHYVYVKPKSAWILQNTHFPVPSRGIQGISIVDSLIVWAWAYDGAASSNQIKEFCKTTDGGKIWVADSITTDTLKGYGIGNMFALNKDTVYASIFGPAGGGKILYTSDAGKNWQVQSTALYKSPEGFPNFVYFFDKDAGICCGDPTNGYFEIYQTSDGGQNWIRVPASNIPANQAGEAGTTNMYDSKGDTIWFGTSAGRVYRSVDKGLNWTVSSTGMTGQTTVKFRNSNIGFAIAHGSSYAVKKTIDGGNTWSSYALPPYYLKGDLVYVPGTKGTWLNVSSGWPSGSSFTVNDGVNFTSLDVGNQYTTVAFYDEFTGWAGGFNIDSITGGIYKWDKTNSILTSNHDEVIGNLTEKHYQIFPNPVYNSCVVSTKNNLKAASGFIFNMQGKCLHQFVLPASNGGLNLQLDLADLPAGVYILQIKESNYTQNLRFVKL